MIPFKLKLRYYPVWALMIALKLSLALVGLVTCLLASPFDTRGWPKLWVWGNKEDGGNPGWWQRRHPKWPQWLSRYVYTAIRNPVNNLRFFFKQPKAYNFIGQMPTHIKRKDMEADDLMFEGMMSAWWFRWSGWKAGYRKIVIESLTSTDWQKTGRYSEYVIGFKLGTGVPGCGFSVQVRRNRRIGT